MSDRQIYGRPPKSYIPGYDFPLWAEGIIGFLDYSPKKPVGRPKILLEIRERQLFLLLMDICHFGLGEIKSHQLIADRLHKKLPQKYPRIKKSKTGKIMRPELRKKVTAALKLFYERPDRVKQLLVKFQTYLDEMDKRQSIKLAK
jgi:hypothetical protein